jgi:hypothetical protein
MNEFINVLKLERNFWYKIGRIFFFGTKNWKDFNAINVWLSNKQYSEIDYGNSFILGKLWKQFE